MPLGFRSQMRVRAARHVVRFLHRSPRLRARVLARRATDIANGLDPDTAFMIALGEITGDANLAKSTPAAARRSMAESIAIVPGAAGALPARIYVPSNLAVPSAGLVFVHGGGWVTGDLDTHDTLCRRLALVGGMRIVSIAPRMAPEYPFPAAIDDTLAAFRHIAKNAEAFGIDPERIGIGGDSAGGNLSALVGLETRSDDVKPALTVLVYPALDATCSDPSHRSLGSGYLLTADSIAWYLDHYLGEDRALRTSPRVSPLHCGDVAGAPPALVVNAGFDPLRDEAERYVERLRAAGTDVEILRYPALVHGFLLMTGLSAAARAATEDIARRTAELLNTRERGGPR
jgi:acetyl esterase